jgi:acetyl-CoA C-acetyltransferase
MPERAVIAGVGMAPFTSVHSNAAELAVHAVRSALSDAGLDAELVDQAVASHAGGDSRSSERVIHGVGITGIAISNVSNGTASGSAALLHARQALLSSEAQCVLAFGFGQVDDWSAPAQAEFLRLCAAQHECMADRMGISDEAFARVAMKARAHALRNPYAVRRDPLSLEEALAAPTLGDRLRRGYASEPGSGAAAVVLCTARFAARHGLRNDVVVAAHVLEGMDCSDLEEPDLLDELGRSTTRRVADKAYDSAGVDPADVGVAEVHDCCVSNELISCAALGLCSEAAIDRFVLSGANTHGGTVVVSPSGGLLARGNPAGATGLAQICELAWQLRGDAGSRQVPDARIGLQHDGGFGDAVAVAILRREP